MTSPDPAWTLLSWVVVASVSQWRVREAREKGLVIRWISERRFSTFFISPQFFFPSFLFLSQRYLASLFPHPFHPVLLNSTPEFLFLLLLSNVLLNLSSPSHFSPFISFSVSSILTSSLYFPCVAFLHQFISLPLSSSIFLSLYSLSPSLVVLSLSLIHSFLSLPFLYLPSFQPFPRFLPTSVLLSFPFLLLFFLFFPLPFLFHRILSFFLLSYGDFLVSFPPISSLTSLPSLSLPIPSFPRVFLRLLSPSFLHHFSSFFSFLSSCS